MAQPTSNSNDDKNKPQVDKLGREINPYIPKYIANVPWYQAQQATSKTQDQLDSQDKDGYLAHQRLDRTQEPTDHSIPQAGGGIKDDFEINEDATIKKFNDWDSKRDRWHGYSSQEWDNLVKNWDTIKSKKQKVQNDTIDEDSDDTDYELELIELGLSTKDIKSNLKEDPLEKTIRDRQDVPAYILNITSNANNKISYDPKSRISVDPTRGFLNDRNQFVRYLTGEAKNLEDVQKFAWDQNREYEEIKQRELLEKKLSYSMAHQVSEEESIIPVDLDLSLEASPTLMMLKTKQLKEKNDKLKEQRKANLINKYGGTEHLTKSKALSDVNEGDYKNLNNTSQDKKFHDNRMLDKNGLKRSRFSEDIYPLNHSSIWGSYYESGNWGYSCCRQTQKNAYCTKSND